MRFVLASVALALVCGCRSKDAQPDPVQGSGAASRLRPLARVHESAKLVVGSRRAAVLTSEGWYDLAAMETPDEGFYKGFMALYGELGIPEIFLGQYPIVVGGAEHHERHVRLLPAQQDVALDGHLIRVVALPNKIELWQYDERLRSHLAVVDEAGKLTALPDHELVGRPLDQQSPVFAKQCAAPRIADLVAIGDSAAALVIECNPEAPVRTITYRWPGPKATEEEWGSTTALGFEPDHLVGAGDRRALVGVHQGKLVIERLVDGHQRANVFGSASRILGATMSDDGAVWTLAIAMTDGGRDVWEVARDGVAVPLVDSSGGALKPAQLGFDSRRGVVVLAHAGAVPWLLSER